MSRTGRAGGHLHPIFSLPSPDLLHASFSCCFFPILRRPWVPPGTSLSCFGTQGVHLFPQPRGHWIHGSASGLGWLCAPARAPAQTVYTCTSGMQLATQLRRGGEERQDPNPAAAPGPASRTTGCRRWSRSQAAGWHHGLRSQTGRNQQCLPATVMPAAQPAGPHTSLLSACLPTLENTSSGDIVQNQAQEPECLPRHPPSHQNPEFLFRSTNAFYLATQFLC